MNTDKMKDLIKLSAWVIAPLIIAAFFWLFTQPVQKDLLLTAVNKVLIHSGDSRRLEANINLPSSVPGTWYSVNDPAITAFVFTFVGAGYSFPCVAFLTPEGKVEEIIALNNHGKRIFSGPSSEILKIYISGIEGQKP